MTKKKRVYKMSSGGEPSKAETRARGGLLSREKRPVTAPLSKSIPEKRRLKT